MAGLSRPHDTSLRGIAKTAWSAIISAMKPRVTVVGSANTDMIIKLERIPRPGETILGGEFATAPGGKGANQAVAAARAGANVTFLARLGADTLGDEAIRGYARAGVNTDLIVRDKKTPSGVALIFVAKDGENSIAVASGANMHLSSADVRKARHKIAASDVLLTQLETPIATVLAAAAIAHKAGVLIILNPAPAQALPSELLRLVSVITPNETEAELLTGIQVKDEKSAARAAAKLHGFGVPTVLITLGSKGVFLDSGSTQKIIPAYKVRPVDTTAAGDVFNGALAVALAEGRELTEAVRFANAAAAISVTRFGAQPSAPKRREIDKFFQQASRKK